MSFRTLAVSSSVIVTGAGPHANVMTPPCATASTTAADVQLAAVPSPTTRSGCDVSTACASGGTGAVPSGLPAGGGGGGGGGSVGGGAGGAVVVGEAVVVLASASGGRSSLGQRLVVPTGAPAGRRHHERARADDRTERPPADPHRAGG